MDDEFAGFDEGFTTSPQKNNSNKTPPKKYSSTEDQKLVPLTIKQIREAQQNSDEVQFKVNGMNVQSITLIGKLIAITPDQTNSVLTVDDFTGFCEVHLWKFPVPDDCKIGNYIRVYGSLRHWNEENSVVAYNIRNIIDSNEISYHFLEVILAFKSFSTKQKSGNLTKKSFN